MILVYLN